MSDAKPAVAEAAEPNPPRKPKRKWRGVALRLGILYLVWVVAGCTMMRHVVFPRSIPQPLPEAAGTVEGLQQLKLETPEGAVDMWFVPGRGVSAAHPGPVVIYAHGNAELIEYQLPIIAGYRAMGVSVLLPEYRGYGRSAGLPSQTAITADFVAAYDLLIKRAEVDAQRVIIHGRSVGTGVASALAGERRPAALILTSPFYSVTRMAGRYLIPSFLVSDPFDNASVVRKLDAPILIFHGTSDDVIAVSHGRDLTKLSSRARLIEYDCRHNDFPIDQPRYWADLAGFLQREKIVR
jgi:fermentation-respiration switch protein FrsA (DUF1100 family)